MFNIQNLQVRYNNLHLIDIPDWKLKKQGLYLVTGANGTGKTSLLKKLSKYLSEYEGGAYKGQVCNISALHFYERKVPMTGAEFFSLYSNEKVNFKDQDPFYKLFSKFIADMSSGEFQALVLMSALSSKAQIYIIDEPFSHLSEEWTHLFIQKIKNISKESLVVIVSHHVPPNLKNDCDWFELKDQRIQQVVHGN